MDEDKATDGNGQKKRAKNVILPFVAKEDVFIALLRAHINIGHKGRDLMKAECARLYANITVDAINTFLQLCEQCIRIRAAARAGQAAQAISMTARSKLRLNPVKVGDFVTLPIDPVDQGRSDAPNLICRVETITSDGQHRLACAAGILEKSYTRNSFDPVKGGLTVVVSTAQTLGFRAAVTALSVAGGQGMIRCDCGGECKTGRCKCR